MANDIITIDAAEFQVQFLNLMKLAAQADEKTLHSIAFDRTFKSEFNISLDSNGKAKLYFKGAGIAFNYQEGAHLAFKIPVKLGKWVEISLRCEATPNQIKIAPYIFFGDGNFIKVGGGKGITIDIDELRKAIRRPYVLVYQWKNQTPIRLNAMNE